VKKHPFVAVVSAATGTTSLSKTVQHDPHVEKSLSILTQTKKLKKNLQKEPPMDLCFDVNFEVEADAGAATERTSLLKPAQPDLHVMTSLVILTKTLKRQNLLVKKRPFLAVVSAATGTTSLSKPVQHDPHAETSLAILTQTKKLKKNLQKETPRYLCFDVNFEVGADAGAATERTSLLKPVQPDLHVMTSLVILTLTTTLKSQNLLVKKRPFLAAVSAAIGTTSLKSQNLLVKKHPLLAVVSAATGTTSLKSQNLLVKKHPFLAVVSAATGTMSLKSQNLLVKKHPFVAVVSAATGTTSLSKTVQHDPHVEKSLSILTQTKKLKKNLQKEPPMDLCFDVNFEVEADAGAATERTSLLKPAQPDLHVMTSLVILTKTLKRQNLLVKKRPFLAVVSAATGTTSLSKPVQHDPHEETSLVILTKKLKRTNL